MEEVGTVIYILFSSASLTGGHINGTVNKYLCFDEDENTILILSCEALKKSPLRSKLIRYLYFYLSTDDVQVNCQKRRVMAENKLLSHFGT